MDSPLPLKTSKLIHATEFTLQHAAQVQPDVPPRIR
jgi:hypothetical protein